MAIVDKVRRIQERILAACIRSGRDPATVRLMGVSKFHEFSEIEEAWNGGIRLFGESRVQEAVEKFTGFKTSLAGAELHMIGSLQRNKAKTAVSLFDCIQSVDRDSLVTELGSLTSDRDSPLTILLELHTGESSKAGFLEEDHLFRAVEHVLSYPGLALGGLMTMAPYTGDEALIRAAFRSLVSVRNKLEARFPEGDWSGLSMGMSNDFEIAIEEGSTLIRIGTAIFGEGLT